MMGMEQLQEMCHMLNPDVITAPVAAIIAAGEFVLGMIAIAALATRRGRK